MKRALIAAAVLAALAAAGWAGWWYLDPTYYAARELQRAPYPLRRIDIDPMPPKDGVEYYGRIRFDLYIGRDGRVDRVENVDSTMPPAVRDRIVQSFREARWQPGHRADGRDVRSLKRVEVDFEPPKVLRRPAMAPDS